MLGNKAIARGVYESGAKVATAYPGTPSTEITEYISLYDNIYTEWSPNEKVALEVAIGASFAGARSITTMKHVGLNVAADPLFTVSYTGINGGLVIVVADDPGMHSSQNEQDSRFYARAAKVPMLEPSDSQEAKDFIKHAFEISEKYDTPVIVRLTTRVAHSQSLVEFGDVSDIKINDFVKNPQKNVMIPAMARPKHILVENRMNKLAKDANNFDFNRAEIKDKKIGVITSGIVYQYIREVFPDISVLKLGMVHPLPKDKILDFANNVQELYVLEELEPIIEEQIKSWGIKLKGKELLTVQGEYSSNLISSLFDEKKSNNHTSSNMPQRPPVMCPGCPHRAVFYNLNRLKLNVVGDIGCYSLGVLPPLNAMDTLVCMGASIGMAHGYEKARGEEFAKSTVAVIGDSTFIHSGITGLIDIVYNKGISTILILDNSTTGMTGHQDNPLTGRNISGEKAPVLNLEALIKAIGINRVTTIDPFKLDESRDLIREEANVNEPSVIIFKRACALLDKVNQPYYIDVDKCTSCGMCLKLGCPAIQNTDSGMLIDDSLCNGCGLCVKVCKFNAIERTR